MTKPAVEQDTGPALVPGTASSSRPSLEYEEAATENRPPPSTCAGQRGIQLCGLGNAIPRLGQSWGALRGSRTQGGRKPTSL